MTVAAAPPVTEIFAITLIGPSLRKFLTKAIPIKSGSGKRIKTPKVTVEFSIKFEGLHGSLTAVVTA